MGFRFRKSISAGPFKVNLSKSGIGWSFGGQGVRFTKKAGGGTRSTFSIPGTGISYSSDSKALGSSSGCSSLLILPFQICWWSLKLSWWLLKWLLVLCWWLFYYIFVWPVKRTYQGMMDNKLWAFIVCSIFFPPGALLAARKKYPQWSERSRRNVMVALTLWSVIWLLLTIIVCSATAASSNAATSNSDVISAADTSNAITVGGDVLSSSDI